ncbi:hypothetical protein Syun_031306 [Stephania yunnanensis]|uniref:Aspartic peptidase DDI1-type domain-containing protein n=1 Tax=Stephania yunnanensis TaxID=152371 RepID=A0AAP0E4D8_9MAGN
MEFVYRVYSQSREYQSQELAKESIRRELQGGPWILILLRILDERYKGVARGVGQSEILGRIHVAAIKDIPSRFLDEERYLNKESGSAHVTFFLAPRAFLLLPVNYLSSFSTPCVCTVASLSNPTRPLLANSSAIDSPARLWALIRVCGYLIVARVRARRHVSRPEPESTGLLPRLNDLLVETPCYLASLIDWGLSCFFLFAQAMMASVALLVGGLYEKNNIFTSCAKHTRNLCKTSSKSLTKNRFVFKNFIIMSSLRRSLSKTISPTFGKQWEIELKIVHLTHIVLPSPYH